MEATKVAIDSLLTVPTRPKERTTLEALVQAAIDKTPASSNVDMTRNLWEYHLRKAVIDFAATERSALHRSDASYYPDMRYRLELVLTFTDLKACTDVFPSSVLQDLFEAQTVGSCAVHFDWVEARAARLSAGLVPNKGKALLFLRTFNDLLRRVPRHGRLASLSGRIGTWLANAYEISERSAVNLRGEYGPAWEDVNIPVEPIVTPKPGKASETDKEDEMQVDASADSVDEATQKKAAEKAEFYNTFWSIQKAFARPSIFDPQGPGATTISDEFTQFKSAIEKILPYLKEASAKDRALMGLKAGSNATSVAPTAGTKRKRSDASVPQDYLFTKYLTNPELLDLEITDVHFRRQILFQVLIALHNLLQHTAAIKATRSNAKNQVPILRFTLPEADEAWVRETLTRVRDELRSSVPQGRSFDESVATMLAREENWMRWKLGNCDKKPFARPVWGDTQDDAGIVAGGEAPKPMTSMWDATREARAALADTPSPWAHQYGSEALTEIWAMGYRELRDIQDPASFGTVADFARQATLEDRKVDARKKQLRMQAERIAANKAKAAEAAAKESKDVAMGDASTKTEGEGSTASATPPTPFVPPPFVMPSNDPVVLRAEETKQRVSWLALRTAREGYALTLAKASPPTNKEGGDGAGTNPVDKTQFSNALDLAFLAKELDNEQKRRETEREERAKSEPTQEVTVGDDEGKEEDQAGDDDNLKVEGGEAGEADVKEEGPQETAAEQSDVGVKMETS